MIFPSRLILTLINPLEYFETNYDTENQVRQGKKVNVKIISIAKLLEYLFVLHPKAKFDLLISSGKIADQKIQNVYPLRAF